MNKLKTWLQNANGWRRLWFALSSLSFFYMLLINPFLLEYIESQSPKSPGIGAYYYLLEKEFKHPRCKSFIEKPFNQLTEPEFAKHNNLYNLYDEEEITCRRIYDLRHRRNLDTIPYTEFVYEKEKLVYEKEKQMYKNRQHIFESLAGAFLSIIISALVYFAGITGSWIADGFRKK
jgi:hypothetical protein